MELITAESEFEPKIHGLSQFIAVLFSERRPRQI
jgi:hypothetical protein